MFLQSGMSNVRLTEPISRKFIQMSYKYYGSGPRSRSAQFVVDQCVHILYALRCVFLVHCLDVVDPSRVEEPQRLSLLFLNSQVTSNFSSIQDIKRPAKKNIPEHHGNNIEWIGKGHTALMVHIGLHGLDRVEVSHAILFRVYECLLLAIQESMMKLGVPIMPEEEFDGLRDGLACCTPNQGLAVFNKRQWWV